MEETKPTQSSCQISRWQLLKAKVQNLAPEAFKARINQPKAVLIDVRTPSEFEASHLSGAINISYFAEDFWERIEALNKDDVHLICCRSGRRSVRVCTLMRNGGFDTANLFNLDGGLLAWQQAFGENSIR